MSDDDLIRRALGGDEAPEVPGSGVVERAVSAGNARRRRRMWTVGAIAASVVLIGGVAAASVTNDDDAVVGVDPTVVNTTSLSPPSPTSSAPTADVATSVASIPTSTTSPPSATTSTTTTDAVTTTTTATATAGSSTTSTSDVTATTHPPYTPLECPESLVPSQALVDLDADGGPPEEGAFLVYRSDDDVDPSQWITELWTRDRRWGSVRFNVPDGFWHCFSATSVVEYDGRWLWIAITSDRACPCAQWQSILVRADMTSGELSTVWRTIGSQNVIDVLPDGTGGALVLTGPGGGAAVFVALYDVAAADVGNNEPPIDAWNATHSEVRVGEIAPDRSRIAYAWSDPSTGTAELYLDRVGQPGLDVIPRPIDLSSRMFFITDVDWSPDSAELLVQHDWEGSAAFTMDTGSDDPASTVELVGTRACMLPDGSIVTADWEYVIEAPPILGDIVRHTGDQSSVIAESVDGGDLVCLPSGHVVWQQVDGDTAPPSYRIADLSGTQAAIDLGVSTDGYPIIHRW